MTFVGTQPCRTSGIYRTRKVTGVARDEGLRRVRSSSARSGGVSDLGTVTIVFTDLVDSTARAALMGPDASEATRRRHFA